MAIPHSYKSESTNTAAKHRFVMAGSADKTCKTPTGADVPCVGISDDNLVNGEAASVVDSEGDMTELEMSENCSDGDELTCAGTSGKGAVIDTNATPVEQYVEAIARQANTAGDGARISVRRVHYPRTL